MKGGAGPVSGGLLLRGLVVDDSGSRITVRRGVADSLGLLAFAAVIGLAFAAGTRWGRVALAGSVPPLSADWYPLLTWWLLVPGAVAAGAVLMAWRGRTWSWSVSMVVAIFLAFAWVVSLNMWPGGGLDGLAAPLATEWDYAADLGRFDGPLDVLRRYSSVLPDLSTHNRSHPPGPLFVQKMLVAVGVNDLRAWALAVCAAVASSIVPVALVTRRLAGADVARRLLPLLAVVPFALWAGTSMDALFLAAAAWTAAIWGLGRGRPSALLGGMCGGMLLLLSFGLAPFALVLLALRRDRGSLVIGAVGTTIVLGVAWLLGYNYVGGILATAGAFRDDVSSTRSYAYWVWANIATVGIACGPALVLSLRRAIHERRRALGLLALAAFAAIAMISLQGFSRGEFERIALPYMPWALVACGVAPGPRRALLVGGEAVWGIVVSVLFVTAW